MPAYLLYPTVTPHLSSTCCPSLGVVWIFWIFESHSFCRSPPWRYLDPGMGITL